MNCITRLFKEDIHKDVKIDTTKTTSSSVTFKHALEIVFEYEGIYSNDRHDSGGKTKFGIIEKEARRNGYEGKMIDMPKSLAEKIYKVKYWDALNLDNVSAHSPEIAIECFECGVNMGIGISGRFLQRSLNALNRWSVIKDLKVDGKVGLLTVSKLGSYIGDYSRILKMQNSLQGARYIKLSENNNKLRKFMRGWFKRVY